jgi:hypothetical protein
VVVLVVVDVVVVLVVVVVVDAVVRRAADVVVARSALGLSSRPWKRSADVETTMTATTASAPISQPRLPNRPTPRGSASPGMPLSAGLGGATAHPFLGISRNGLPLLASGSLGRPSTRSPRMLCWISSVPPR